MVKKNRIRIFTCAVPCQIVTNLNHGEVNLRFQCSIHFRQITVSPHIKQQKTIERCANFLSDNQKTRIFIFEFFKIRD